MEHNIKVTTIAPGWVISEFWEHHPEIKEAAHVAQKRGGAITPENIVEGIVYALEQPDEVNIGDLIIQPLKQEHL